MIRQTLSSLEMDLNRLLNAIPQGRKRRIEAQAKELKASEMDMKRYIDLLHKMEDIQPEAVGRSAHGGDSHQIITDATEAIAQDLFPKDLSEPTA